MFEKAPHNSIVDEDPSDQPYHEHWDCGSQDLRSVPSEGHLFGLRSRRHPDGEQGDGEGGDVGEEVRGVGGDGQGVAEHSTHHLGRHEEGAETNCS